MTAAAVLIASIYGCGSMDFILHCFGIIILYVGIKIYLLFMFYKLLATDGFSLP